LPHALIKKEFIVAFTKKSETEITKTLLSRHDVTQMFCARGDQSFASDWMLNNRMDGRVDLCRNTLAFLSHQMVQHVPYFSSLSVYKLLIDH